jgi:hypothetical protein
VNPFDFAKRVTASVDELRHRRFEFCSRCGATVKPYRCNEFLDHDESWNYDERLPGDATVPEGEAAYWCPQCQTRWRAFGAGDTGSIWSCGHFMPFYVTVCAVCGALQGSPTEPNAAPDRGGK